MKPFSFNRKEKLKSRKQLENIFNLGKTFTIFPVKVFFDFIDEQDNIIKAGVGVSKRIFKKAVDRNRIKRLLREVYRTEKVLLQDALSINNKKIKVFFLYVDKTLPEYYLLQQKMKMIIEKLSNESTHLHEPVS